MAKTEKKVKEHVDVRELISEIKETRKQTASSRKEEIGVMQAMLNDTSYEVGVYGKEGKIGTYKPAEEFRKMQANVIASTTKISKTEAAELVSGYEFSKNDASALVDFSKEFVNTYLGCGRKLPLGGREETNYALLEKDSPKVEKIYQRRYKNDEGEIVWEPASKTVPAHKVLKAKAPCPTWVK